MTGHGQISRTLGAFGTSHLVTPILLCILTLVFVFRVLLSGWLNLLPDECSYWTWSRRLDWSYFDNSGMAAYLIRLSTEVFGVSTPFTVRFPFLVLSFASTYVVYRVSVLLFFRRRKALLAAVIFNVTPVGILGGSAAVHDNALIFFWLCALYGVARFHRSFNRNWFVLVGLAVGLAILSKYTGALLAPCILFFLIMSKEHRVCLIKHEPWLGVLVAAALAMPVLMWNLEHEWASLNHILFIGAGAKSWSQRLLDGLGYHGSQFLIISPLIYIGMLFASFHAILACIRGYCPEKLLLLSFGAPLVLFGVMAFRGHVEANWSFMGYASLLILSVEMIGRGLAEDTSRVWRLFRLPYQKWSLGISLVTTVLVIVHGWIGLLPASWESKYAKDDRIIWETHGWKGLGSHIANLRSRDDVLAADSYQLCALLEFNVPGQPYVRYLAPWDRPTQFDVWEPSFDNLSGRTILFVSSKPLYPSSPERTTIYEHFAELDTLPAFHVMYHDAVVREVYLYRGYNFNPSTPRKLGPRDLKYLSQ